MKKKIAVPNLALISGNGRNSGKTLFATHLIKQISKTHAVTGIKITPHFHWVKPESIMLRKENYVICEEREITNKDSSLMLQAGADKVYFIMVKQEHLHEAFVALQYFLPQTAFICESGGLNKEVAPGIHFFIKEKGKKIENEFSTDTTPIIVERVGGEFNFDFEKVQFMDKVFSLKN